MEQGKNQLKIWEIALLLIVVVCLASCAATIRSQEQLAEKVVRLHVLANSDSEEDQALKLVVRDAILQETEELLESTETRAEVEGLLRGQLLELEQLANETVKRAGYNDSVTVELEEAEFPTRTYESFSLPAGEYLALRVLIGNAEGQNWWCVVFPPLCTVAAAEFPETVEKAGFSDEEIALITEESAGYVLKFRLLELFQKYL